ncbi:hypothetical protein AGMMS49579_02610 [Spirochaetia bacterium]|nr:hypothetical protein AGMMS49579_02610 [Spirochaetia bacterium]
MIHEKELTDKEIEELTKQFDKESNVRQLENPFLNSFPCFLQRDICFYRYWYW